MRNGSDASRVASAAGDVPPHPPVYFVTVADKGLKLDWAPESGRERAYMKGKLRAGGWQPADRKGRRGDPNAEARSTQRKSGHGFSLAFSSAIET